MAEKKRKTTEDFLGQGKQLFQFLRGHLLFLSLFSFVLIASTLLALLVDDSARSAEKPNFNLFKINQPPNVSAKEIFPDLPVLVSPDLPPTVSAQGVLAVDLNSGVFLYEKNPDEPFLPASTVKVVTALVVMDHMSDDQVVEVGDVKAEGQKMGLVRGEKILVGDLLSGLLIKSANDAAEVLAQSFPGGRENFIKMMNEKSKELNLTRTYFKNPSGIDGGGQVTTARDLINVSRYAMENPRFAKIVGRKYFTAKSLDGRISHLLVSTNKLLNEVEGVLGVKTGWTEAARENLVTYVERDGKKIMIALLGSQDRFGETKELIDWIYTNYTWQEVSL